MTGDGGLRLHDVPIKLENVGIAVRDLEEAIAFFTDLGLTVWFNTERPHEYLDDLTPARAEELHYIHISTPTPVG